MKTETRNDDGIKTILPCVTAVAQQETVLSVTAATHLTVGLLQVQIHSVFLVLLSRLLHRYLDEAPEKLQTSKKRAELPFKIKVGDILTIFFTFPP